MQRSTILEREMATRKWHACMVFILALFINVSAKESGDVSELQIGVKFRPKSCETKAHIGDKIRVHYDGMLTDGTIFDSSYDRDKPLRFTLGHGRVIKGWDQGLLGMCLGEKRRLKIPPELGYGDRGSRPNIPGGATLIFDTLLVDVNGQTIDDEPNDAEE